MHSNLLTFTCFARAYKYIYKFINALLITLICIYAYLELCRQRLYLNAKLFSSSLID